MAMRLEDDDERISNLARLFFHELSKKGESIAYFPIIDWDYLHSSMSK